MFCIEFESHLPLFNHCVQCQCVRVCICMIEVDGQMKLGQTKSSFSLMSNLLARVTLNTQAR